eukprot:11637745-Ditylum_brightwellii.AAC.1
MRHITGPALPTMAISCMKYNHDGIPIRPKYRIVALGNLDTNPWSKADCFAPVLSQMELRLLLSIAVKNKVIPQTGDVSQAFCQSYLPQEEKYVLQPPPGCFLTPKDHYLLLRKTLYGLREAQDTDNITCFGKSPVVEEEFKKQFGQQVPCKFNGKISDSLGLKFTCRWNKGDLSIQVYVNQPGFIENFLQMSDLDGDDMHPVPSPYSLGYPVNSIPKEIYPSHLQAKLTLNMQKMVGCINWLAISTRLDLATTVNLLAKYMAFPSTGHIEASKGVVRYIKGTKKHRIAFHSNPNNTDLAAYVKLPIENDILVMSDANWGPQDASVPKNNPLVTLEFFKQDQFQ